MSFCKTHYKARSTTGKFYQKILIHMNDKSVFHAHSIWMALTYLCQLLWCGLLLGLCQSYLYCWSVWANQSHRLYLVSTHMYPSQSHSGLGEKKRSQSWIIFLLSWQTVTEQKRMNYFLKLCVQRLLLTWSWRCLR